MDDLIDLAADNGVRVIWRDLGRRRGEYRHGPGLITINPRMSYVLQRSTLAHELGHASWGDEWTDDPAVSAVRERRADLYAARLLISVADYAAAESAVGPHDGALARELGVARRLVEAWRRDHVARRAA